jgi:hypothetical protein
VPLLALIVGLLTRALQERVGSTDVGALIRLREGGEP